MSILSEHGRRRRARKAEIVVRVGSRFDPETIFVTAGERTWLRFRREINATSGARLAAGCSRVIFPSLGRSIELPLLQEVALELVLNEPGRHEFTCERGLLRGVLEVGEQR